MKKTFLISSIVVYGVILVTLPGVTEYVYLRYFKGISPQNVEAAVAAMKLTNDKMNEALRISSYITADEIRKFDGEALRNFYSELNRSIEIEQEFAFTRSLRYYAMLQDSTDVEQMKKQLFLDLTEDYHRFLEGPSPETNQSMGAIDDIADREPQLAILIGREANKTEQVTR